MPDKSSGALFVTEIPTVGDSGPVAVWLVAAEWAAAAERRFGASWIVTGEGIFSPDSARVRASRPDLKPRKPKWWRPYVPEPLVTAYKDLVALSSRREGHEFAAEGPWGGYGLRFVWQYHQPFHRGGFALGKALRVPVVLFVDAPAVWEDARWGVHRPGWGKLIEKRGERPQFISADLVACVSDEVAAELARLGVRKERIIVTPNGVDGDRFGQDAYNVDLRQRLGLRGRFVVGWMGSFRPFHGVELLVRAAAMLGGSVPDLSVLMVGDGQDRHRILNLAGDLGVSIVTTGTVPYAEVPSYLACMDVAVVLADGKRGFHYSPMKLREYMASGVAVIAPRVGEIARTLVDERDALLVEPGNPAAIARAVERLRREVGLRQGLGAAGRKRARASSWDGHIQRVDETLAAQAGNRTA